MSPHRRRLLALALTAWAVALGTATAVAQSVPPPPDVHCKHKPCESPPPTPGEPTPAPAHHTASATPLVPSQVQSAATSAPYDNPSATPGPIVGTVLTPQAVLDLPAAAPTLRAHPQGEPGLATLILIGGVLGIITLTSVGLAIALR